MQIDDREYDAEVRAFVASFAQVQQHHAGRWMAWLDPAHDFVRDGPQPPGQVNAYHHGEATYTAENRYWNGLPPIGFDRKGRPRFPSELNLARLADRLVWRQAWAARPFFHSHHAAAHAITEWIWGNRPDIVRTAKHEVREAIAYRRRMTWKTREQARG